MNDSGVINVVSANMGSRRSTPAHAQCVWHVFHYDHHKASNLLQLSGGKHSGTRDGGSGANVTSGLHSCLVLDSSSCLRLAKAQTGRALQKQWRQSMHGFEVWNDKVLVPCISVRMHAASHNVSGCVAACEAACTAMKGIMERKESR
jgi:hypothetical protein